MLESIIILFITTTIAISAYFIKRLIDDTDSFQKKTSSSMRAVDNSIQRLASEISYLREINKKLDSEIEIIRQNMSTKHDSNYLIDLAIKLNKSVETQTRKEVEEVRVTAKEVKSIYGKVLAYDAKVDRLIEVLNNVKKSPKNGT